MDAVLTEPNAIIKACAIKEINILKKANSIKIIKKNIIKNIIKKEKLKADISAKINLNLIHLNKKEIIFTGAILNPIANHIKNRFIKT